MNVGDYIRTEGIIAKVKSCCNDKDIWYFSYDLPNGCEVGATLTKKYKTSPQIIDLIEIGDYVNGHLVKDIDYAFDDIVMNNKNARILPYIDCNKNNYIDDIKTIVTHEQMEAMQYRVEE